LALKHSGATPRWPASKHRRILLLVLENNFENLKLKAYF